MDDDIYFSVRNSKYYCMHFSSPHYVELVSERCSNSLAHFISSSEAVLDIHDAREKKLLCLVMRMRLNNKNSQITFNNLGKTTFEHKNNVLGTLTKVAAYTLLPLAACPRHWPWTSKIRNNKSSNN